MKIFPITVELKMPSNGSSNNAVAICKTNYANEKRISFSFPMITCCSEGLRNQLSFRLHRNYSRRREALRGVCNPSIKLPTTSRPHELGCKGVHRTSTVVAPTISAPSIKHHWSGNNFSIWSINVISAENDSASDFFCFYTSAWICVCV